MHNRQLQCTAESFIAQQEAYCTAGSFIAHQKVLLHSKKVSPAAETGEKFLFAAETGEKLLFVVETEDKHHVKVPFAAEAREKFLLR